MIKDFNLQAPWVGQSDWDYFGWKTEEEEQEDAIAYWEHVDRLIDEMRDEEAIKQMEENHAKQSDETGSN